MSKNRLHYAWIILIAVSLIRGVAGPGINASSGVFLTPVSESLGIGIGKLSLYLSISSIATLIWLPIAGNLFDKFSAKTIAVAGILLQTISFIVLGWMNTVWAWYVLAVPLAMGGVFLVNLLGPLLINRWFAKKIGLVMGIMMMITSLLGAVFQPALTSLIQNAGWRRAYLLFGLFAMIFMLVIALLFLKSHPKEKGLRPFGEARQDHKHQTATANSHHSIALARALRSLAFFSLLFFMIVLTGFASFQQHIATFGLGLGLEMTAVGRALSISMIGSAIGSVLIGIFSDKLGIVPTSVSVMGVGLLSVALFFFGGSAISVFLVATFLHGLASSSIGVVAPLLTKQFFGDSNYEKLFSSVMIGAPLASIVLMPLYGFIYDRFQSYDLVLGFLACALTAAAIGLMIGYRNSKRLSNGEAG